MRSMLFLSIFILGALSAEAQYGLDTVRVYFDIGKSKLSDSSREQLSIFAEEAVSAKKLMLIYGYADYLGEQQPNSSLSNARANVVADFLKRKKILAAQILQTTGVGEINIERLGEHGNQLYRSVLILVKKQGNNIARQSAESKISTSINIDNIKVNETLRLQNINFIGNRSTITSESQPQLEELLLVLQAHPSLRIRIEGHVCCTSDAGDAVDIDEGNEYLSVNRARTVYKYLLSKGVEAKRLAYIGLGHSRPLIAEERSDKDGAINRRVEIRILAR